MGDAKRIRVEPIAAADSERIMRAIHYSGRCGHATKVHLGVFLDGRCGGAIQFGQPIDKRRVIGLVRDTAWDGMIELNRFALADWMPRNCESRALAVSMRLLARTYPSLEWVLSYADCTQCGDGTIYRASGFWLTAIKANSSIVRLPSGRVICDRSLCNTVIGRNDGGADVKALLEDLRAAGFDPADYAGQYATAAARALDVRSLPGYQLRYIRGLRPGVRERLTVPVLPYSDLDAVGARMYRGEWQSRAGGADSGTPGSQPGGGGASPTPALHPGTLRQSAAPREG